MRDITFHCLEDAEKLGVEEGEIDLISNETKYAVEYVGNLLCRIK